MMILIVDDDSDLAETCSMMLEACGFDVRVALSAKEAMVQISTNLPELLISDCCMPEMTGLELSAQLRSAPLSYRFPILLMSGSLECDVALGKNYDAFIKKPFLAETMLANVRMLLHENGASLEEPI
jgi:DNA-binding response OmpR family regulator